MRVGHGGFEMALLSKVSFSCYYCYWYVIITMTLLLFLTLILPLFKSSAALTAVAFGLLFGR